MHFCTCLCDLDTSLSSWCPAPCVPLTPQAICQIERYCYTCSLTVFGMYTVMQNFLEVHVMHDLQSCTYEFSILYTSDSKQQTLHDAPMLHFLYNVQQWVQVESYEHATCSRVCCSCKCSTLCGCRNMSDTWVDFYCKLATLQLQMCKKQSVQCKPWLSKPSS